MIPCIVQLRKVRSLESETLTASQWIRIAWWNLKFMLREATGFNQWDMMRKQLHHLIEWQIL